MYMYIYMSSNMYIARLFWFNTKYNFFLVSQNPLSKISKYSFP